MSQHFRNFVGFHSVPYEKQATTQPFTLREVEIIVKYKLDLSLQSVSRAI
ncbi:hypothetical protein FDUTEX481_07730 [Tolypothrix sp. PCC 7601]|nr:hypothetical protein FDUTEX481_07730 [Tolypothrix sp. PCC 7601]